VNERPQSEQDDDALIQATLAGDASAFGEIVVRYQDRLFSTLVHVTGDRAEAEDVAQDAFVQAYRKLSSFQGRSGLYTWIYRIAYNRWISGRRKKRASTSVEDVQDKAGIEPLDHHETPLEAIEREERADLVHVALGQLSDEQRSILMLREMEGCDYETISDVLSLPVGTVRSRLHRARHQLKQKLELLLKEQA